MFRVEFFIKDQKLGDALRALAGKTLGHPNVQPVVNVEEKPNGKLIAKSNGGLLDMFGTYLARNPNVEVMTSKEVGQWLEAEGFSKTSNSYLARMAVKAGMMKRTGGNTHNVKYVIRAEGKHV